MLYVLLKIYGTLPDRCYGIHIHLDLDLQMIFMHLDLPEDKLHIVLLQMPPVIKQKIPGLLPGSSST